MRRTKFWKTDGFLGLAIISGAVLLAAGGDRPPERRRRRRHPFGTAADPLFRPVRPIVCPDDRRPDLFSPGLMLYPPACGHPPFVGESTAPLMFKSTNEPHMVFRRTNPRVSSPLSAIIDRALSKDIGRRHQSGDAMLRDVRASRRGKADADSGIDLQL